MESQSLGEDSTTLQSVVVDRCCTLLAFKSHFDSKEESSFVVSKFSLDNDFGSRDLKMTFFTSLFPSHSFSSSSLESRLEDT